MYPEAKSHFKEWMQERRNKKINDVLWAVLLGVMFFLGVVWMWNIYQLIA